ncbi:hypothetical protein HDV00_010508 [Rhizophlyctis rosea]|nr:hypothetical protein HDV00_010508 [Rhizophlyctis rosea]
MTPEFEMTFVAEAHAIAKEITKPLENANASFDQQRLPRDKIKMAIKKLYRIMQDDKTTGPKRLSFQNPAVKNTVRSIGEELNAWEGMPAMHLAYYGVDYLGMRNGVNQLGDLRCLDYAWDGIGDWRA